MNPKLETSIVRLGRLRQLGPIIESWFEIQRSYARNVRGDLSWWYKERSQVGFFASAVSHVKGAAALEEWSTKKGDVRDISTGRNDLWFRYGKCEWFIEAKYACFNLQREGRKFEMNLKEHLNWVKNDAGRLREKNRIAMAFVAFSWREQKNLDFVEAREMATDICKDNPSDVLALITAGTTKYLPLSEPEKRKWVIGLALFMSIV